MKKALIQIGSYEDGVKLVNGINVFCTEFISKIHLLLIINQENIEYLVDLYDKSKDKLIREKQKEYEQIARSVISEFQGMFVFTWEVAVGLVGETIVQKAKEKKVDLIVLGTQQEKVTKRLASTPILYVAEASDVPVLLIPLR